MFELGDTHRMVEKMVRAFCEKEVAPKVAAMEDGEVLVFDLMRQMAKAFGLAMMIKGLEKSLDKKSGDAKGKGQAALSTSIGMMGMDADPLIGIVIGKEIARVSPSLMMAVSGSVGLTGATIMAKGTPAQKKKYGLPLLAMDKIGAWGMTEPDSGSDAFALRTIARPVDGGYMLNGQKIFITNAPYADIFVIYAKIDRGQADKRDKRFVFPFIVKKGAKGLAVSKSAHKLGMRGSPNGEVFLDDVFVPADQLLGESEEKSSREQAKEVFASERSGAAVMCWGIIERCLEDSIKYAIERQQFGRPIADFQLIQAKIAQMYIRLENVRNIAFKQAWAMKEGKGSAEDGCVSKYYCANAAVEVALDAIQLMGGYGYMREYHVEMLMRDAKLMSIAGGTDEIQLLTIAKELFRKNGYEITIAGSK
jgi:acyl-CoA dehydrogenase